MQIIKDTNIDFLGKRKIAFVISGILGVVGLLTVLMIWSGKANLGIDFAGGASATLVFQTPVNIEDARGALKDSGFKSVELQSFTDGSKLLVKIKDTDIPTDQVIDEIMGSFKTAFPDNAITDFSSSAIGPTVGKSLQKDALKAVVLALICIVIYIAFRFELKFGLAATVATFHDVLAVLAVFYIMNLEISLLIVTALLTIAGYSLTDTVVVFDRIRENLKLRQKDGLEDIINSSINEVLSRTVVTSLTTFLVVFSLYLFGGEVLHDFSFALMMGVIIGTYSSIFVASTLLYVWRGQKGGKLIKAAMLTRQPAKAAVRSTEPKPVMAAASAAEPKPAGSPKAAKANKKNPKRDKKR
jgi:preprotein translocase subunit SecF